MNPTTAAIIHAVTVLAAIGSAVALAINGNIDGATAVALISALAGAGATVGAGVTAYALSGRSTSANGSTAPTAGP